MAQLPTGPDTTPTHLWNPLTEDYTNSYATEENVPQPYTLPAQEITTLPAYIANKLAKNLAQYIVLKRGIKTNYEDEYQQALQEVVVKL